MSEPSVRNGDVLAGKYRVERVLGAGGMGYVVAARHLQLDQLVAMKFLRKGAVDNSEAMARFLREAKAVVKLRNEHVAKVFDVGTLDTGEPYIVMEHLDGKDLSEIAKDRHTLPAEEVSEYVMQACEALAEAHAMGIIHRDIKLANIFVSRGPAGGPLVKVLDFGISKTNPFGESEHDMTRTASMLGSPRFMSPEQMRDPRAVDGRTDIWSLGVVLYRLVSGRPPFEADTLGRLLTMVMHEQEVPLGAIRKDLPTGFEDVVARCLQKDPQKRYANVSELAYALVPFVRDQALARAAADRIGAVQQTAPVSEDISIPIAVSSSRHSRSYDTSEHGDAGTAAPWVGTHGSGRGKKSATTTIGIGVAFVALLAGAFIFAQTRQEPPAANATTDTSTTTPTTTATPIQAPAVTVTAPPIETTPPAPTPEGIPQPPPLTLNPGATSQLPAGTITHHDTAPPRHVIPTPTAKPKTTPKAPTPTKSDDGIPSTRD